MVYVCASARACLGTLWCVLVFVYLCEFACTFVRALSRADPFDALFLFPQVDLAIRRHFFFTRFEKNLW